MEIYQKIKANFETWFRATFKIEGENLNLLYYVLGGFFVIVLSFSFTKDDSLKAPLSKSIKSSWDTVIPTGYVLVPIEVANLESIDSLLGDKAVVDIYTVQADGKKSRRALARKVKVIRAPQNPSVMAVLTPEAHAADILTEQGPFFIAIQNPNETSTEFKAAKRERKTRIIFN